MPGFCVVWDSAGLAVFVEMEIIGATGGASNARTHEMNAQGLCTDAKPTERS